MMLSSLKRFTVIAGITCAISGAGNVALAGAADPPPSPIGALPSVSLLDWLFPAQQPAQSCGDNQGTPPGVTNLGPTGPLGPLGADGPLGVTGNGKLPCGSDASNLGPNGPLGPHGSLGLPGILGGLGLPGIPGGP
jgi:hypothetical protein